MKYCRPDLERAGPHSPWAVLARAGLPGSVVGVIRALLFLSLGLSALPLAAAPAPAPVPAPTGPARVVVIPLRDEVAEPMFYILRRGLKQAITDGADTVVLDLKTPGGELGVTFEMMEAIAKFPGKTITFVNDEAMSAGAFISATTDEIWFAPKGVIGAAAPVQATGADVDVTMKQKLTSYLTARMRANSEGRGYRGEVVSAMIDSDLELKIEGQVLKEKGRLLSLTATEAGRTYGTPPQPLLSAGIAENVDALLRQHFGPRPFTATTLEETWSENLAKWLLRISPVLLGLGIVALYIEFKTPGFGVFGVSGITLLALVFLGTYAAGLSGHEPVLVFILGVLLVAVELFFFPGLTVLALAGIVLVLGSLVWAMADLWPNEPLQVAWSGDVFVAPMANLGFGLLLAVVLVLALARFLPKGWIWDRLVLHSAVGGSAQQAGLAPEAAGGLDALVGRSGLAVTALRPAGQVEVDGRRYEASAGLGAVQPGETIVVRGRTAFGLLVERTES
jgi:membrane-bound serine protease (ClpP class)